MFENIELRTWIMVGVKRSKCRPNKQPCCVFLFTTLLIYVPLPLINVGSLTTLLNSVPLPLIDAKKTGLVILFLHY